jgi:hypothetical protein
MPDLDNVNMSHHVPLQTCPLQVATALQHENQCLCHDPPRSQTRVVYGYTTLAVVVEQSMHPTGTTESSMLA